MAVLRTPGILRPVAALALLAVTVVALQGLDASRAATTRSEKLYFPSGEFLERVCVSVAGRHS